MRDFNFIDFFIQKKRFKQVAKYIPNDCDLLDVGCGRYPYLLSKIKNNINKGIGIDKDIPEDNIGNVEFIKSNISEKIEILSGSIDVITMLAVLEHFLYPQKIIAECGRVLKKNGLMIITVPSFYSRPILSFLASTGIGSKEEIYDHKYWFKKYDLEKLVPENQFKIIKSSYYNFNMNIFMICKKI